METGTGSRAQRQIEVTQDMVEAYARLTGDYNPLHFDAEFAARTRFRRLICQGGITTGLLHALVAMDLPGPGSVFVNQRWSFPRPVFIGDTITATATVTSARQARQLYELEFVVRNQGGEEVLTGTATLYRALPST